VLPRHDRQQEPGTRRGDAVSVKLPLWAFPLQNATTGSYAGMLASRAVRIMLSTAKKTIVKMVTNAMLW
jgi:hypothetical protein